MALPVSLGSKQQGVLVVWRPSSPYTPEDQSLLQTVRDRAALTLLNAELFNENLHKAQLLSEANALLEQRIQERTEQLHQANVQLQKLATQDGLTGLFNRRTFDEKLSEEVRRAVRSGQPLSLMLCDIDYFKRFNDHYGHPEGDRCLKAVASLLQTTFQRAGDTVARYGGEEFVVILSNTGLEQAKLLTEGVKQKLQTLNYPHEQSEVARHVTLSMGVVTVQTRVPVEAGELVKGADDALYHSKHSGRNMATVRPFCQG